jgi:hypothetical protein
MKPVPTSHANSIFSKVFFIMSSFLMEPGSSVGVVAMVCTAEESWFHWRHVAHPASHPMVTVASPGVRGQSVKLATYLNLVPRFRIH